MTEVGRAAVAERAQVSAPEHVASATALAVRTAARSGLREPALDAVRLVTRELAENLHRHGGGGELFAVPPSPSTGGSFSVYAMDQGPGVERFERCLVDGYSTGGTLGGGLGAARRMCDDFDAVSEPGYGTVVRAAFRAPGIAREDTHFDVGAFGLPIDQQPVSGDAFAVARRGARLVVLVSDGLGHGPQAAEASAAAVREFTELTDLPPAEIVEGISRRIVASRGAAITVAGLEVDVAREGGAVRSAGLGNVAIAVVSPDTTMRRVATSHGTAGSRIRQRVPEQSTPFPANGVLVLHSDGLTSRWTTDGRIELLRHAPDLIAAALWRDHHRSADDSLVVVVRARPRTKPSS